MAALLRLPQLLMRFPRGEHSSRPLAVLPFPPGPGCWPHAPSLPTAAGQVGTGRHRPPWHRPPNPQRALSPPRQGVLGTTPNITHIHTHTPALAHVCTHACNVCARAACITCMCTLTCALSHAPTYMRPCVYARPREQARVCGRTCVCTRVAPGSCRRPSASPCTLCLNRLRGGPEPGRGRQGGPRVPTPPFPSHSSRRPRCLPAPPSPCPALRPLAAEPGALPGLAGTAAAAGAGPCAPRSPLKAPFSAPATGGSRDRGGSVGPGPAPGRGVRTSCPDRP